jgi:predicted PurR-regulated permease PerM
LLAPDTPRDGWGIVVFAAATVGVFAAVSGLYLARGFLLPIILAGLARLVLGPIVRACKRLGVPEPVGAAILLLSIVGVGVYGAYRLADPAVAWLDRAPESIHRVETKLRALRKPVDEMTKAADRVESLAVGNDPQDTQTVTIKPVSWRDRLFSQTSGAVTVVGLTFVLLFFLLAYDDIFLRKVVKILPTLPDKKMAVEIARKIETNISRYLLSLTLLNCAVGCAVVVAMALIGLPNPVLWGVMVAVLSFIPYVGPLTSEVVLALVGVMTFDSLGRALVPPAIYLVLDVVTSNFIAPAILGRRLELNPVMIFLAVAFWTWLWGIMGALLAVPMLATAKIFCDAFEPLAPVSELLSE